MRKGQSLGCPEAGTTSLLTVHCSWCSSLFSVYVHWEVGRRPRSVWSLYFLVCFLLAVLGIDLKGLVHSRQLSYHEAMTLNTGLSSESSFNTLNQEATVQAVTDDRRDGGGDYLQVVFRMQFVFWSCLLTSTQRNVQKNRIVLCLYNVQTQAAYFPKFYC